MSGQAPDVASSAEGKTKKPRSLHPDDLVDDRELRRADEDRFEHARIADQLVELATMVEAPANIALYGPWGSGKTGIANLMREKLTECKGVSFARFDAFKYAENPLRRNFVTAVARELGVKNSKYHDDLYSGRTRTDVRVPAVQVWKLLSIFAGLIAAIVIILIGIITIVSVAQSGGVWGNFTTNSREAVSAGLLPAALLAGLIALVGRSLQVDRSLAKPDSDEQFEHLLSSLVADSNAKRVVIFVDELDRCSSEDVVATLDAVRTFLGVEDCVFIVAADQQVLETALSKKSRQTTPAGTQNPYYSTGSAYLDKVFQHQVSLPDLLAPNIAGFAFNLISGRTRGVWSELKNAEMVISILVPSHVASPRRVKHLLNTFALTYRLAEDRYASGHLNMHPAELADALAKLVCLRVEFPLFARDLTVDADLPAQVLAVHEEKGIDAQVSEDARSLASRYAKMEALPATFLAADIDYESDTSSDYQVSDKRTKHHEQLLNYLRRTRTVDGLTRDLVYLQTEESLSGLNESAAKELITAAADGDASVVVELLNSERIPPGDHESALRYLTIQMRLALGVGSENIARTLLISVEKLPDLPYARIADDALVTISSLAKSSAKVLTSETVPGAWKLALLAEHCNPAVRSELIQIVAADDDADYQFILASPEAATSNPGATGWLLTRGFLYDDPSITLDTLRGLSSGERQSLLRMDSSFPDAITEAFSDAESEDAPNPSNSDETTEEDSTDPEAAIEALASLAHEWAAEDPSSAYAAVDILLDINRPESRGKVHGVLGGAADLPQATRSATVRRIVSAAKRRHVSEWPVWFDAVQPDLYEDIEVDLWNQVAERLWVQCSGDKPPTVLQIDGASSALLTLLEPQDAALPDLTNKVLPVMAKIFGAGDETVTGRTLIASAVKLTDYGLVDRDRLFATLLVRVTETVASSISTGDMDEALRELTLGTARDAFVDQVSRHGVSDEARGLLSVLSADSWVDPPERLDLLLQLLAVSTSHDSSTSEYMPTGDDMQEIIASFGPRSIPALVRWLKGAPVSVDEANSLLAESIRAKLITGELAGEFSEMTKRWSSDDHMSLIETYVKRQGSSVPHSHVLTAVGFAHGPVAEITELLISRYKASTNNPTRKAVLELWSSASITNDKYRALLFREILIPMLRLKGRGGSGPNSEAVKTVLGHVGSIGQPPTSCKKDFGLAVDSATSGSGELERLGAKALEPLGYKTKRTGLLRSKRVDLEK